MLKHVHTLERLENYLSCDEVRLVNIIMAKQIEPGPDGKQVWVLGTLPFDLQDSHTRFQTYWKKQTTTRANLQCLENTNRYLYNFSWHL